MIFNLNIDNDKFSGINGFVNKRPYIVINSKMNPERQRSTMLLLAMRAKILSIVTENTYKNFIIRASQSDWRKNEPSRIEAESSTLFEQLTYRAVVEGSISVQKGAELLEKSNMEVESACFLDGGQ